MAVIKWSLNYVSCNFGLKSYLRVWNHACHFRPNNCTPLCSIMIINRFYCAKSAIKPTSPVKSSEKLRPTCLLSHTRSWFFSFWNTSIYPTPEYMTQRISRPSRSVPRPYYYFFFRGERERACRPQKTSGTRITVPSSKYLKIECYWERKISRLRQQKVHSALRPKGSTHFSSL